MAKRITGRNRAGLGIRQSSLKNFILPDGNIILQTTKASPLWELIHKELPGLLADLNGDSKYSKQVERIGRLMGNSNFPKIEEITFTKLTDSK